MAKSAQVSRENAREGVPSESAVDAPPFSGVRATRETDRSRDASEIAALSPAPGAFTWLHRVGSLITAKRARIAQAEQPATPSSTPVDCFLRINAPVFSRPAGFAIFGGDALRLDPDFPRLRIYSDDRFSVGDRLRLAVYVRGISYEILARVAWVDSLADEQPARFDLGFFVYRADPAAVAALRKVIRT